MSKTMKLVRESKLRWLLLLALMGGCEESESPKDPASPEASSPDGKTDSSARPPAAEAGVPTPPAGGDEKVGEISVRLVAPVPELETPGFTTVVGKVFDGPAAETKVLEPEDEVDDCVLLIPRVPFCDPPCGGDICVEDDMCRASPKAVSVGKLTVKGVKTEAGQTEFSIEPAMMGFSYQNPASVKLPYPAFEEGDEIAVSAAGGTGPGFTLEASAIAPLMLLGSETYALEAGKPIDLTWTAAAEGSRSRIQVKLDISHHGGSRGEIQCDTDDDGAFSVPAALLDTLTKLGVAGFPTIVVTRSSIGSGQSAHGRVDLKVYSYVERAVQIPGLTSCNASEDCPSGETCGPDLTCG